MTTEELVSLGVIGTDTGYAGCRWVETSVSCEEHTHRCEHTSERVFPPFGTVSLTFSGTNYLELVWDNFCGVVNEGYIKGDTRHFFRCRRVESSHASGKWTHAPEPTTDLNAI